MGSPWQATLHNPPGVSRVVESEHYVYLWSGAVVSAHETKQGGADSH